MKVQTSKVKNKTRKSITINTTPIISMNTPSKSVLETPKSILKKKKDVVREESDGNVDSDSQEDAEIEKMKSPSIAKIFEKPQSMDKDKRPVTLDEYIKNDSLMIDPTASSFIIDEIDEDDELWVFDIPRTLNPRQLKGQTFYFGDKTKLKISNERYLAISYDKIESFTCVMGTGRQNKRFKTVNIQPSGGIILRKKLGNVHGNSEIDGDDEISSNVPFPENIKTRHPLMNPRNLEKKSKRFSPVKSRIKRHKSESSD